MRIKRYDPLKKSTVQLGIWKVFNINILTNQRIKTVIATTTTTTIGRPILFSANPTCSKAKMVTWLPQFSACRGTRLSATWAGDTKSSRLLPLVPLFLCVPRACCLSSRVSLLPSESKLYHLLVTLYMFPHQSKPSSHLVRTAEMEWLSFCPRSPLFQSALCLLPGTSPPVSDFPPSLTSVTTSHGSHSPPNPIPTCLMSFQPLKT